MTRQKGWLQVVVFVIDQDLFKIDNNQLKKIIKDTI